MQTAARLLAATITSLAAACLSGATTLMGARVAGVEFGFCGPPFWPLGFAWLCFLAGSLLFQVITAVVEVVGRAVGWSR